ncbi:transcription antitermination factor NusB [Campylobacter sp. 19-13652]|uniref:transcription antitermination factor NusB n=1 Tax=Campylobacter sp. 19-13652 TaxID=2840180 RepID=UPI001C73E834|nr:transcription antitermination factor NusB [Campylobacter sp. 19-13652]BCX79924.1 N utilization substance protein B [Campylobacter sp. 19-13652]
MATRHQARQAVVSLLYADELSGINDQFLDEFLEGKKIRNERRTQVEASLNGISENLEKIDAIINENLKEHKVAELGVIERAILRLGVYEMKFSDTDAPVIINEAIELAKELGSESAPKLVNGVLDAIKKAQ